MSIKFNKFNILLIGVVLLNFFQALLTPIIEDEAYYWRFSENLDWGFFHHPPMIALLIYLNKLVFSGILSVRFLTVILMALTIKITWSLIPLDHRKRPNSELIFFGIFLSIPICHIYGFITTPDIVLLFFGSLYLLVFKRFKEHRSVLNTILLGLISALLLYSKYHGAILILLSVFLNAYMLKELKLYLAGLIAFLLILPHIYWHYQHDFASIYHQLFNRNEIGFDIKNVTDYIFGSALIINPVFLFIAIWFIKVRKLAASKELKFYLNIIIGFLLFFLINALRSKTEAHWVAFALIPLVLVIHSIVITSKISFKTAKTIIYCSLLIMLTFRILVVLDLQLPTEFHREGRDFFTNIDRVVGDKPVAFMNSYQKAAKFSFYTGKDAYSLNNTHYRKNQYDFSNYETKLHNKDIFVISNWPSKHYDSIKFSNGEAILGKVIPNFQIFSNLKIRLNNPIAEMNTSQSYDLSLTLNNPYSYNIALKDANSNYKIVLELKDGDFRKFIPLKISTSDLASHSDQQGIGRIEIPDAIPSGKYNCTFVMRSNFLPYQTVGDKSFKLRVRNVKNP